MAGIHFALVHSQTDWVAIMLVDMPLLTAGVYRSRFQFLTNGQPVVAESEKELEPLVPVWSKEQSTLVEQRLENQTLSIYRCVEALNGKNTRIFTL